VEVILETAVLVQLALVVLIVAIGSAVQASIGMGLNLFAIPLLILVDPIYAPGPVLVASMLLSALALWRVPAKIDWNELKYALGGLLAGTIVAAFIVISMDTSTLVRVLGFLIVFAVFLILSGWGAPISNANLVIAGSGAGLLGTIAGVHAPPIALLYQGQNPERVRGAILTFVCLGNGFSIAALSFAGHFKVGQMKATLILLPGVLLGLLLAPALVKSFNVKTIRFLVLAISAASGITLVVAR